MPITMSLTRPLLLSALVLAPLLSYGQSASPQTATGPDIKQMPPIPSSSALLQSAVNDLNTCIATSLSAAANAQKQTTTDAITSQCATQQAKLKQMLPPDAYNMGAADTQQRVSKALAAQAQASTPQ